MMRKSVVRPGRMSRRPAAAPAPRPELPKREMIATIAQTAAVAIGIWIRARLRGSVESTWPSSPKWTGSCLASGMSRKPAMVPRSTATTRAELRGVASFYLDPGRETRRTMFVVLGIQRPAGLYPCDSGLFVPPVLHLRAAHPNARYEYDGAQTEGKD